MNLRIIDAYWGRELQSYGEINASGTRGYEFEMIAGCGVPARSGPKQTGGGDKANGGNVRGKKRKRFHNETVFRSSFIHVTRYCCDDCCGDGDRTIVERVQ